MGRKKKKASKPWCWYCNREFDDEKILIQHQKAKHFKCHICHKKLYTGPGLSIHCMQVHKEAIDKVPNSLPNRTNIEIEIYGMEGIPPEDIKEHDKQRTGNASGKASDSEDDEPTAKKKALNQPSTSASTPLLANPIPGMPPAVFPGVQMMPPMPPFMQGPHRMMMPPGGGMRPLFPAASGAVTSTSKPTFPAYSNATISAPPTTSTSNQSSASENGESSNTVSAPLVTATGAGAKIMHPPEDVSLEEIKARQSKYQKQTPPEPVRPIATSPTVSQAEVAAHMAAAAAARQHQAVAALRAATRPSVLSTMPIMSVPRTYMPPVAVSMPNMVGMMPIMPQFNMLRPATAVQLPPGMIQLGGMMTPMGPMFPGGMPGLSMMPPRFR